MTAALYPAEKNSDRTSSYPHYSTIFNFQGINFPMTLDQIGKFEKMNNLSINVYSEKEEVILPVRVSKEKKERHFNLLYIEDVSGCGIGHFAWIKNLSRLVNSQLNSDGHKKYICDRCLHYFPTIDKLQFHEVDCGVINDCAVRLPAENDKWLEFTNANRKERLPFVVYADLECILEKTSAEEREKNKSQHHRVFSVGYYVKCSYDDSLSGYHERRGEDCVEWFVEELKQLALRVEKILLTNVPMKELSPETRPDKTEIEEFLEDIWSRRKSPPHNILGSINNTLAHEYKGIKIIDEDGINNFEELQVICFKEQGRNRRLTAFHRTIKLLTTKKIAQGALIRIKQSPSRNYGNSSQIPVIKISKITTLSSMTHKNSYGLPQDGHNLLMSSWEIIQDSTTASNIKERSNDTTHQQVSNGNPTTSTSPLAEVMKKRIEIKPEAPMVPEVHSIEKSSKKKRKESLESSHHFNNKFENLQIVWAHGAPMFNPNVFPSAIVSHCENLP
ncbi:uncharacterized protein [Venturia canescens]|uniref:uncharacterized protein n=1 Tax=Venturia canescens TaxID=32260 RepID=UPI001C9CEAC9|nr:uncharacterized protein LOC122418616 [Venturia canescens]